MILTVLYLNASFFGIDLISELEQTVKLIPKYFSRLAKDLLKFVS